MAAPVGIPRTAVWEGGFNYGDPWR
jgi:hypothetical protein